MTNLGIGHTHTDIRGGGYGSDAWIARITGPDPKYTFAREFCPKNTSGMSRSGRSGVLRFTVSVPGLYQFRHFCVGSTARNWEWSGFAVLDAAGGYADVSREDALAMMERGAV